MANIFAPNGFQDSGLQIGAAWSANQTRYQILYSNTHTIFQGDPVTLLSSGYIDTLTPGSVSSTVMPVGIFNGCYYISASQGRLVWSAWYPGGDQLTNGVVYASIVDDPNVTFVVQTGWSGGSPVPATQAMVGMNATYAYGTGNQLNGQSGAYLDLNTTPATTAAFPFRILSLVTDPPGSNGSDTTTAYNKVLVMWNNEFYRQLTGV
jgi:hypothetical protein